ncbi:MAG: PSD1 and planctomycete cytochrome C domain-containing protein, partial [Bryobacterales bacterium]|nr:PSD1 and planctomycete cytochrome C domain-containing protein [Bryobacterales bacterium]
MRDISQIRLAARAVALLMLAPAIAALAADQDPAAPRRIDFDTEIRPLFERRCTACHGPENAMNGLRLDRKADALAGGHSGPAIIPGNAAESRLIQLVSGDRVKAVMPPTGEPLGRAEIGRLRAWIDQGAPWPDAPGTAAAAPSPGEPGHWAFQPVVRPAVPAGRNPIDHFVRERLRAEGFEPAPRAERDALLARVSLDLTGIPPTWEEQAAFREDPGERAYERVVERLLSSQHFGEKQALHWLDQVRYADSDGYAKDYVRPHAWRYRRWVINALNAGMGFDRFSIEQIAGDLLPGATVEQRVATGFHRNTLRNREGGVNRAQYAFEETVDRAGTFGTVWLGLTVGCAQCHDHKYDPVSQKEFYELFAFFDNLAEGRIYAPLPGEIGPYLRTVNEYRRKRRAILDEYNVPALQAAWEERCIQAGESPGVYLDYDLAWQELGLNTDGGQAIVRLPPSERTWRQADMVTRYFLDAYSLVVGTDKRKALGFPEALRKLKEINRAYPQRSEARVVYETPRADPTFLRVRGSWDRHGIEVTPGTPGILPGSPGAGRLELARWLFADRNPLTARVAVNRIWQEYFGGGLVATSEDFGTQGERPSHPRLLDWLASEFRDSGWDVRHMHRLIVTSETYKQSSRAAQPLVDRDPGNVLLGRQVRLRLPAELIWDRALAAAGLLHHDIGGRSFRPAMPPGTTGFKAGGTDWEPSSGAERYKRGMYIQFQRTQPFPFLMNFDSPEFRAPACRRERSNTPLQALNLLNGA